VFASLVTRYQVRNGLPITGQLEFDTSKALGAVPAVVKSNQQSDIFRDLHGGVTMLGG
jgi:hypothetical protein